MVAGEAGIGKTTLWRVALAEAEGRGYSVLACRPAGSEVRLSFAGLADLFEEALDDILEHLPGPQREALSIALLRVDGGGRTLDDRAVFAGVLGAIRWLAGRGPLVIAIDDAQWLDPPSADALAFAIRRLRSEPVAILASVRTDGTLIAPLGLDTAFGGGRLSQIDVGPMSFGALHELLRERTGRSFTRPTMRRITDTSGGNPFYALELARAVDRSAAPVAGEPIPLPPSLEELLGRRLADLPPDTRTALFLAAAMGQGSVARITEAMDRPARDVLAPAVDARVVRIDGDAVTFTHPLLAAAAYALGGFDREPWHALLAESATQSEERARHTALAIHGRDAVVADLLAEAARAAGARGAPGVAADMWLSAVDRTPMEDIDGRMQRLIEAARSLILIGERRTARSLLESSLAEVPSGVLRASMLILLAELVVDDVEGGERERALLEEAIREAGDDTTRHAEALLALESVDRWSATGGFDAALAIAREALALAERAHDPRLLTQALTRTADLEVLIGHAGDPVARFERAIELDASARIDPGESPSTMLAVCLMRAGRLAEARPLLVEGRSRAVDAGDDVSHQQICVFLTEIGWLTGDWREAEAFAREGLESAEQAGAQVMLGSIAAPLALLEGCRGEMDIAVRRAREAAQLCDSIGEHGYAVYNRHVLGFLELSRGNAAIALDLLSADPKTSGVEGTKRITFIGDEIHALIQLGRHAEAGALVLELEQRGTELGRPPLLAIAARNRALLQSAGAEAGSPEPELARAIQTFSDLGFPFERARTLLALGEVRQRAKQKRATREAFEEASAAFEALGAPVWAARARKALDRIGGRTTEDGLTPTERRVAELVADGMSNKEVASALFVSVRAVEANLTRIYAKLDVGSRSELVRKL